MHVLLTGGSSFLGHHLTRHLLRAGLRVTATYRTGDARLERLRTLGEALDLVRLDLAEERGFAVLPATVDAVVHVAAVSLMPGVTVDDLLQCNVAGTRNVLGYALAVGATRLIYASSLSVHGRITVPVVDETTPVADPDVYGATKYLGERLLAAAADRLPAVAIRLPGVLGHGAHRAWVPTLLERMRAGQDITIYNPDSPFNNAAHVDDLGWFIGGLLRRYWQGFHALPVAASGTITVREAVERLRAATGSRSAVTVRPAPQPGFTISSERAIQAFGYRPMEIGALLDRYAAEAA